MCGLAGFYPKKNKKVRLNSLLLLGIMNETRGEDSCGISIGNEKLLGTKNESVARNFIVKNIEELNKINLLNKPCIFHTRKSTIGAHNEENAHPFMYTGLNDDDDTDYFAIAHNGIIRNTNELQAKFLTGKIENLYKHLHIDSHYIALSLALAFVGTGDEKTILETYEGNAALLYYNNKMYKVWKGGSGNIEERPMYYIETSEGWYFCSIETSLKIIFNNKHEVIRLRNNELLTFKDGKLENSSIIERTIPVSPTYPYTKTDVARINSYSEYEKKWKDPSLWNNSSKDITTYIEQEVDHKYEEYDSYDSYGYSPIIHKKEKYWEKNPIYIDVKFSINQMCYIDNFTGKAMNGVFYTFVDIGYNKYKIFRVEKTRFVNNCPIIFKSGILIQSYTKWNQINARFNRTIYKSLELFYNKEKETIVETIVDFLPLYEHKDLTMVIYKKENGFIDYITKYDLSSALVFLRIGTPNLLIKADKKELDMDITSSILHHH